MRLTSPRWAIKTGVDVLPETKRINVINPSLCNDAINLLRPSLPKPGSCDIIDINPGACVWTRALHEALQPRRHILVERDESKHSSTIEALASQAGSKYRVSTDINEAFSLSNLSDAFREHHEGLDEQQRARVRRQHTNELIITANLTGKRITTTHFHGAPCKLFLDQFYRSIAFDVGAREFNRYGLVRLLAWVPDREKQNLLPKSTIRRFRLNKNLEASCHIREIVSSSLYQGLQSPSIPWHDVAVESGRMVVERQQRNNLHIPQNRQQPPPLPLARYYEPIPKNFDKLKSIENRSKMVDEFMELWHAAEMEDEVWLDKYVNQIRGIRQRKRLPESELLKEFTFIYGRMRMHHSKYVETQEMVDTKLALEQELISVRKQYPEDEARYLELLEKIRPKLETIRMRIEKAYKDTRHESLKAIDDFRALHHDPPVLAWHNRPHEPLLSHPKEDFQPTREPMTLVELVPKVSFVNAINTSDKQIAFDYVSICFDYARVTSLKKGIEDLVGTGDLYDAFIQAVPSLTDPLYGGWYDLSDVRIRGISTEALIQIALAYEAWPYRISIEKMLERLQGFGRGVLKGPLD